MLTHSWYDSPFQPSLDEEPGLAALDDDVLDDWLASMTARQFDSVMTLLVDSLGTARTHQHRSA